MADPSARQINFEVVRQGHLEKVQSLLMTAAGLERLGNKSIRKGINLYTKSGRGMMPKNAFETVVNDGTCTVVLIPKGEEIKEGEEFRKLDSMSDANGSRILKEPKGKRKKLNLPGVPSISKSAFENLGIAEKRPSPFANLSTTAELSQPTGFLGTTVDLSQTAETRLEELRSRKSRAGNSGNTGPDRGQPSRGAEKPQQPDTKKPKNK